MTVNKASDWLIHNLGTVRRHIRRVWSSPWFVIWRDAVEPKYPWWDQTSWICCRSVPKKVRLGIYRTQIRPKTRRFFFFSYREQSGVVERHVFILFWSPILFSNSSSAILFNSFVWSFIFWVFWSQKRFSAVRKVHASARQCSRFQFWREIVSFPLSYR